MDATRREFLKGLTALVALAYVPTAAILRREDSYVSVEQAREYVAAIDWGAGPSVGAWVEYRGSARSDGFYRIISINGPELTVESC